MTKNFSLYSFVAGVMLGALLAGAWFFGGDLSLLPPESSLRPSSSGMQNTIPKSGAITVVEQPAGDSVIVESVTVPPPGVWIAVREVNGDELGNVLGAARVTGPRSEVSIPLLRATEPGRAYAVQLYRDDATGPFDPATYSVYVDFDTGARVVAYFTTTE
jgi:hypothetical protein